MDFTESSRDEQYGKLALLRVEDLSRRVNALEKKSGDGNALFRAVIDAEYAFTAEQALPELMLLSERADTVLTQLKLTFTGGAGATLLTVTPRTEGVDGEAAEIAVTSEKRAYEMTLALTLPNAGQNSLVFTLGCGGGGTLHRFEATIAGQGVRELKRGRAVFGFSTQHGAQFAVENGTVADIILQSGNAELSPARFSLAKGTAFAAAPVRMLPNIFKLAFFSVNNGILTAREYDPLTGAASGAPGTLAQKVTAVAAGKAGNQCVAAFISEGKVYAALVSHGATAPVFSPPALLPFSGRADAVAVLAGAFASVAARVGRVWYLVRGTDTVGGSPVFETKSTRLISGDSCFGADLGGGLLNIFIGEGGTVRKVTVDGAELTLANYAYCDGVVREGGYEIRRTSDRLKVIAL